jgi:hypothetical protein
MTSKMTVRHLLLGKREIGGITATITSGATLELAGSVSALGTGSGSREHVANNSLGAAGQPAGLVVSATNQVVGGIDGSGRIQFNPGSDLRADHIIQGALVVGGAAGTPGMVTIDATSDANRNPLGQSRGFVLAGSLRSSGPSGAGKTSCANLSGGGSTELETPSLGNSNSGSNLLSIPGTVHDGAVARRHHGLGWPGDRDSAPCSRQRPLERSWSR